MRYAPPAPRATTRPPPPLHLFIHFRPNQARSLLRRLSFFLPCNTPFAALPSRPAPSARSTLARGPPLSVRSLSGTQGSHTPAMTVRPELRPASLRQASPTGAPSLSTGATPLIARGGPWPCQARACHPRCRTTTTAPAVAPRLTARAAARTRPRREREHMLVCMPSATRWMQCTPHVRRAGGHVVKPEAEMTGARAGRHSSVAPSWRRRGDRAAACLKAAQAANAPGQLQRQYTHMTKA